MKTLFILFCVLGMSVMSASAKSDADVTELRIKSVTIEDDKITIVAAAHVRFTVIQTQEGPHTRTWMGYPAIWAEAFSQEGRFIITKPPYASMEAAWQNTLQLAKDWQTEGAIARIGYYAPDISLKGNIIQTMSGPGYLYPKQ